MNNKKRIAYRFAIGITLFGLFGFSYTLNNKEIIAKLHKAVSEHKTIDFTIQIKIYDSYNDIKSLSETTKIDYRIQNDLVVINREDSKYIANKQHVIFIDHKEKTVYFNKELGVKSEDINGLLPNMNLSDELFELIKEVKEKKLNDSITEYTLNFNSDYLPSNTIVFNNNWKFFKKIEYKVLNEEESEEKLIYSKVIVETLRFSGSQIQDLSDFKTSTYLTKQQNGNYVLNSKYKGYKLILI